MGHLSVLEHAEWELTKCALDVWLRFFQERKHEVKEWLKQPRSPVPAPPREENCCFLCLERTLI